MLLQTSMMQQFISKTIVTQLAEKLHTKVTIGKIEYTLFNNISLHNLYIEDQQKDTLIFVKQADAHFKFWKFFQGKIIFTSVDLAQLYGNLIIDKNGHSNLDFVIKAFKQPQKKDSTQIEYQIRHFGLKNSRFNYTNLQQFKPLPSGVFNANNLKFKNINADISLEIFQKDSINVKVKSLSAEERTGLILKDFKTQVNVSSKNVKIPFIDIKLPKSQVHLTDIQLKYDSLADFKHFAEKVRWNAPITLSSIAFSDLKAFVPEFKNVRGSATIKGLITGRISSLHFQKMEVKYGNSFLFHADLDVNGLPNLREAFIYGQIKELQFEKGDLQDFISEISNNPFILPKEISQLGLIKYKGNISGFLNNLVVFGNLNTNIGSVSTDILLKFGNELRNLAYNGTIKSDNLQLGKLLSNKQLGKLSFSLNTKGTKNENSKLQGILTAKVNELQFNNYSYQDVQFGGKYDGKGFDGTVDLQDQNINAHFNGKIDLTQKLPVYDFDLKVNKVNLNALKLTDKYPGSILSFNGKTNIIGNSLDNINGFIRFDSIQFTNKDKILNIEKIQFTSRIDDRSTHFVIASDYVNGGFSGNFKYSTVKYTIDKIVQKYLPSLSLPGKKNDETSQNNIDIDLKIENTSEISNVLDLPYSIEGISTIKGSIDEKSNKIDVSANFPMLKSNKQQIENITFHFDNPKKQLQLTTRAQLETKDGLQNIYIIASAIKDSVKTKLGWQNTQEVTNAGEINTLTRFKKEGDKTSAVLQISPSQVIISDSVWNIHPCRIDFKSDSTIQIHNFVFDNHKQFVHINGIASKSQTDSVNLVMNNLDLDFVMGLLKLKGTSIGGIVTGRATLLSLLQQPIFEANIKVKDLMLNHKLVGDGNVTSNWDKLNSQLLAHGAFVNEKKDTIVVANGVFTPKTDTISVVFNAHNFNIEFLNQYFQSVVQDVKGYATGKVRLFGLLKHGISFEGDAYVDKGQASVKTLKTTYYFNDYVHLSRDTISLRNIKIYDQERNPASLNATLTHNGFFHDMKFDVKIAGDNILALNTQAEDNDYFFGKAYANGTVHIYGDEKEANIFVNAISQPNTKCYIQMGGASKASDNSFIHFVNKNDNELTVNSLPHKIIGSDMNVKVNLQIEVTPDAEMELIVDPKGGDVITGKGNGNLRIEFDTFSDIKLYGTYTINSGYYLFTLQNLIRKEFKIDQGSTLAWTGNPYNAQCNIRALYPLTASLRDLMGQSQLGDMRSTVPVNCVLKLNDNIMKPNIKFEIDLPQSDEGVKQLVRNIINTDEMMNRQILYLLVFNKFYAPDYMAGASNANVGPSEALSFGVSTLSAQLNNWISQLSKSNNLSIGFDYRQTDQQSSDIQAQFLYQPSNRWIMNGNIGYRNDLISNSSTNTNRFISDVDIQYLLNESGKLRLKGYNHTIDRYQLQLRTATQTQGLGFIYKEDFNSVKELFNYYWHLIVGTKKTKTDEKQTSTKK
ncbi:MAG: translocation/assembly module TamB domain-containing protein [Paludibacter sp.]|nr:translocation/assembly module TamB domain-containing protein [Paludibacter sp.]